MLPVLARRGRMQVQLAEAAAERLVLLVRRAPGRGRRSPGSSISASWISWNAWLPSGRARSTPKISAPMQGVSLRTSIVWYPIGVFLTFCRKPTREDDHERHSCPARRDARSTRPVCRASSPRRSSNIAASWCPNRAPFAKRRTASPPSWRTSAGAIIAERNGAIVGCVMVKLMEDDLYLGRLSVLPDGARPGHRPPPDRGGRGRGAPPRAGGRAAGRAHRADREPAPVHLARLCRDLARGA